MAASGRRRRLVLNFHGIGTPGDDVPADEVPYWCPADEWPALADALAEVAGSAEVALEITFDDGNLSDVTHALPALVERGLAATFFVCAGRVGAPGYVGVLELAELQAAGMLIGSHGWDHLDLRRLDRAALQRETDGSRHRLSELVGRRITEFAVPFGSYDRRVLRHLRRYRHVHTSDGGRAPATSWVVPRTSYVRGWGPADVRSLAWDPESPPERVKRLAKRLAKSLR